MSFGLLKAPRQAFSPQERDLLPRLFIPVLPRLLVNPVIKHCSINVCTVSGTGTTLARLDRLPTNDARVGIYSRV